MKYKMNMKKPLFIAALFMMFSLTACFKEYATIKGRVVDCKNNPVAEALVMAKTGGTVPDIETEYTDSNGRFSITVAAHQDHTVIVEANGVSDSIHVRRMVGKEIFVLWRDLVVGCKEVLQGRRERTDCGAD
jgi:hypothetical protein